MRVQYCFSVKEMLIQTNERTCNPMKQILHIWLQTGNNNKEKVKIH